MTKNIAIHWFRQDLRLADNPAFTQACAHNSVLPIFILDNHNAGECSLGGASRWWLHHSLTELNSSLRGSLSVLQGDPIIIFQELLTKYSIEAVYWNRCYEPWRIQRDTLIKKMLQDNDVRVHTHNGSLLWEPWSINKKDGTHYKVFTPFYRKGCLQAPPPRLPLPTPSLDHLVTADTALGEVKDLGLLPSVSWDRDFYDVWRVGEAAAQQKMDEFVMSAIHQYKDGRNYPAKPFVSKLSPHLHFGEISPNQAWYAAKHCGDSDGVDHFCSELGWREFSYCQLYHNPELRTENLQEKFNRFSWSDNNDHLRAWQQGKTGIPMVDAGMRELWQTGYVHNRVRMVVGSFLVKNLLLHWHHGERWFWDALVDADLASNSASWQWVAGCGADAAPYFRVFNPVTQGKKFDPDAEYIKKYIPELSNVPTKYIFSPWEAPLEVLEQAGVRLGREYPKPIVDLKLSRQQALDAFQALKQEGK
jgi:deoxyribodipyrimidine photo-lyase